MNKIVYIYVFICMVAFKAITIKTAQPKLLERDEIEGLLSVLDNDHVRLFLNLISLCEGTSLQKNILDHGPANLQDYRVCFSGVKCNSFAQHPCYCGLKYQVKKANGKVLVSTASGRYQFLSKVWTNIHRILELDSLKKNHRHQLDRLYKKINSLYVDGNLFFKKSSDLFDKGSFNPFMQDLGAVYLLYEKDALKDVIAGNIKRALSKVHTLWASLPCGNWDKNWNEGMSFYPNQRAVGYKQIVHLHNNAKKKIA